MPDRTPPTEPFRFVDADGDYLHIGIPHTPASGGPAISFHTATEPVHVPVEQIEELITALRRLAGGTTAVEPIALPARWDCAHGPSDDEPFCAEAEDDGHVCPTIRVHPSDAPAFAALVDEVHRLRTELARHVQCNDCGAVGEVFTADDGLAYLDPTGQIGHQPAVSAAVEGE